jgi:death on curing protein
MNRLEVQHILIFHRKIIASTGGSDGIRDIGMIESAINRGDASFDGEDFYGTVESKIAAITHSLISNHGFVDGNKRIGVAVMLMLLQMNSIAIAYSQSELVELGLGVASGKLSECDIEGWIVDKKSG